LKIITARNEIIGMNKHIFRYPSDAKERARAILGGCKGSSVGSYSESAGIELIRRHAAKYIEERDGGIPSNYNNIILSNGASDGIKVCI
jgi:alanine transaminase